MTMKRVENASAPGGETGDQVGSGTETVLEPGTVLANKYRLTHKTGVGGMGTVWSALNLATGAQVAIKLMLPELARYAEAVDRFRHEAHATAQLSHRGIVRIFDLIEFGESRSIAIVMELLRGRTLAAVLDERERLPLKDSLEIILPLLSALSYAHAAGVVHRDLKPDNVFLAVDPDGLVTPKILDFGISKLCFTDRAATREGCAIGTPGYMSPEQAKGLSSVDGRSDLFNVGILLYEMLSGKNPFAPCRRDKLAEVMKRVPKPLRGVSAEMQRVVFRALAKDPELRFADATQLARALRSASRPSYRVAGGLAVGLTLLVGGWATVALGSAWVAKGVALQQHAVATLTRDGGATASVSDPAVKRLPGL